MSDSGIFNAAVKLAPEQRAAFLERACAGNDALRREIESLLRAHDAPGSLLGEAQRRPPETADFEPRAEQPGAVIGPYKLMEQIGEGGMGLVFVAEQLAPVRRKVALKIIKPGMDSAQVVARFEAERQALAMMDHLNIAKVLDAGATPNGRPFFVMELVHGVPITEFCNANKLTPRQRLEMLVPVCLAIQHAHQKGIIHRDVKPSNVLVTMYDDKPAPKVIDFGVAKAIEQRLTDKTLYTKFGAMIGTLEYMSPEQAELNAFGVDTRSDVYALGVLLYELLTGTTPLDRDRLKNAAFGEIVRLIKEEEPPRPSVRLSTSVGLPKVAAERKSDPGRLPGLVRGELDWIVMRCLEKDRSRRYESAGALARDLQRHLQDEPVEARPPSPAYKLRMFAKRHRAAVAMGTIFVALIAMMLVNHFVGYMALKKALGLAHQEANRARMAALEADEERNRAVASEKRAIEAAEKVKVENAVAREIGDFVVRLFVQAGDQRPDREFKLKAFLDGAAKRLDENRPEQPLAEVALREIIAHGYRACGDATQAQRHWKAAHELCKSHLGDSDSRTLNSLWWLGMSHELDGSHDQAQIFFAAMRGASVALHGPDAEMSRRATYNLALSHMNLKEFAEGERLLLEFIEAEKRVAGPTGMRSWLAGRQLGKCFFEQRKNESAERAFLKSLEDAPKVRINGVPAGGALAEPVKQDLVKLYTAWGKPAEAAKWRTEKAEQAKGSDR